MTRNDKAMECFVKMHSVLRHQPEVLCQMAAIHDQLGNIDQSIEWYLQVHAVVPSDGGVLRILGQLFDRLGDRQQAFQYYSEVISINWIPIDQFVQLVICTICLVSSSLSVRFGRYPLAGFLLYGHASGRESGDALREGRPAETERRAPSSGRRVVHSTHGKLPPSVAAAEDGALQISRQCRLLASVGATLHRLGPQRSH